MLQLPGRRDVKFLQFDVNDVRLLVTLSAHRCQAGGLLTDRSFCMSCAHSQGKVLCIDSKDKLTLWNLVDGRLAGSAPRSILLTSDQMTYVSLTRMLGMPM